MDLLVYLFTKHIFFSSSWNSTSGLKTNPYKKRKKRKKKKSCYYKPRNIVVIIFVEEFMVVKCYHFRDDIESKLNYNILSFESDHYTRKELKFYKEVFVASCLDCDLASSNPSGAIMITFKLILLGKECISRPPPPSLWIK